jgi:cyclopropane fatty-acyl-phospholipid synthase-like methyltransferase
VAEEFGCELTGVDPGPYQRDRLRERMRRPSGESVFSPVAGDAHDLPFRSRSVNRIYSVESAFHYADKLKFVGECSRALRRDGLLVIADILEKPGRGRSRLTRTLKRALAASQVFSAERYAKAAEGAGMKLRRVEDVSPGVRRAMRLWRRIFFRRWTSVRGQYSLMTLVKIGIALTLTPALAPLAPFHYVILVFGVDENRS